MVKNHIRISQPYPSHLHQGLCAAAASAANTAACTPCYRCAGKADRRRSMDIDTAPPTAALHLNETLLVAMDKLPSLK